MRTFSIKPSRSIALWIFLAFIPRPSSAQTEIDGLMMGKNNFCVGPTYGISSWTNYWEGTLKRDNENLGTITTSMFNVMGNYGISKKLNVLFGLPYIKTTASAGQLSGQKGWQDLSLWIKWNPFSKKIWSGRLSLFAIGGYSFPVSGYTGDYLPMSIGLESKNLSLRGMADYQRGNWFGTVSGTYVQRSNITIDRDAYYTREMHYTNEVDMPDAVSFNARAGFRSRLLIAEAVFDHWNTLDGFDITRNNMPFPGNDMDMSRVGFNFKYDMPFHPPLSITGNVMTTISGRNVGQATGFNAGILYVFDFSKKNIDSKHSKN